MMQIHPDLIARKVQEKAVLGEVDLAGHGAAVTQLQARLETAFRESSLPDEPLNRPALDEFLVRVRLSTIE